MAPDRTLIAVDVKTDAAFRFGSPRPLFAMPVLAPRYTPGSPSYFAVSADGQRFLVNTPVEDAAPEPMQVVVNWPATLAGSR